MNEPVWVGGTFSQRTFSILGYISKGWSIICRICTVFSVAITFVCLNMLTDPYRSTVQSDSTALSSVPVFLNRRAAARSRALVSIIPGRERFSRNLSF